MVAKKLTMRENKCTGCRICELICSWNYEKEFTLNKARLMIEIEEEKAIFSLKVTEKCNNCGLCVKYCSSQALVLKEVAG